MVSQGVARFPWVLWIENTNACNARCVMCPREKLTRKIGLIDSDLFERILRSAVGKGVDQVTLQGYGEPLLDRQFCARIGRVKEVLGCSTYTVSNGSLITPELAGELVACGLDKIKISFYGTNKKEYEATHPPLQYERTCRAVMNLVRAKRQARSPIFIRVQYIGKLWKLVPFFFQWIGKAVLGYSRLHNFGGGRAYRALRGRPKSCRSIWQPILHVLWTGEVVPCCYDFDGSIVLGDLRSQTIEEIWHGEAYTSLREAHARGDLSQWPICLKCHKRF
jgi:hypothetical protein